MKLKTTLIAWVAGLVSLTATAQVVAYDQLQPLHVDGNYLKDPYGNKVVLHGVMDTPNAWFNGGRWGWSYDSNGVVGCINYFEKLFTAITDSTSGAYCNIFRLHLDPAWTNGNSGAWKVDAKEKGDGEADISKYTGTRLTSYLNSLYVPIAQRAMKHGLYVIMRPPGVCPEYIQVGGSYQKFLLDVWDRVSKNSQVKKYSGQISIELANEPRNVLDANGNSSDQALHDFFQPIVDKIRANGFTGVIWIPGSGWQSNYRPYGKYPITGENIGYAVHNYAGWYNNSDEHCDPTTAIKEFGNSVPIIYSHPIVITEVDWSPQNTSKVDHYNEFNQPVYKNYGTWATASTSKWGKAYKAILDYYGNISMTLTGTGDFIDIDDYINKKKVTPAFKTAMEKNGVDPYEACGVACFQWYAEYAKVNYPSDERYQPLQEVPERPFELSKNWFNPSIIQSGSATHASTFSSLTVKQNGCAGWSFEDCIDLSDYQYLVIHLVRSAAKNTYLRIYDDGNFNGDYYTLDLSSTRDFKIDLHDLKTESGKVLDPSHIRVVGFGSASGDQTLYVKEIFLSIDGETEATAIQSLDAEGTEMVSAVHYSMDGRIIPSNQKGIHIVRYSNGQVKKVFIK